MKAYRLHGINNLLYEDVELPELVPGWCLVRVKAAGICSSDIPRIYTKGTYHFPTIPGHEFSGIVYKVKDDKDAYLIGKKVGVFPLIPCRKCEFCKSGRYELCSNYDYIGSRRDGGFAEFVAVPTWNLIELGDNVPFINAAMMEPLSVALHAVKQMELKATDDVAIVGSGMIAFAAAQWVALRGVRSVTVVGRSEKKRGIANSLNGVKYTTFDDNGNQFDAVLEAVGSNDAIDKSLNLVKPGGVVVLMGNPEGDILLSQNTYWRILRKQLTIKGTWNSSYEKESECDWEEVRQALNQNSLNVDPLVSHVFKQEQLVDALKLMVNHKEPYCKVITVWNEE